MLANQKYSSKTSLSLMLMGLLPFIFAIYYLEKYDFEIGLSVFIHYSAIILSFIGAINWGRNFHFKCCPFGDCIWSNVCGLSLSTSNLSCWFFDSLDYRSFSYV